MGEEQTEQRIKWLHGCKTMVDTRSKQMTQAASIAIGDAGTAAAAGGDGAGSATGGTGGGGAGTRA